MNKLFYREYGSGEPLIILHGLLGASDNWIYHGKKFSDFFHVFLLDQMNHGNSPHSISLSYNSLAKDLYNFITLKKLSSVNILGHSMGGKVAMHFALKYPKLINKLIVVDIAPKDYKKNGRYNDIIRGIISLPIDDIKSRRDADAFLSKYVPELEVRNFLLKNLKRQSLNQFLWKPNIKLINDKIEDLYSWDSNNISSNVNVLFIKGEKSNYIFNSDISIIKIYFPNSKLKIIRKSGHWVHVDSPNIFQSIVLRFLNF